MNDKVVGLRAWCDFVPEEESSASPGSVSFVVNELALLADGRRVALHSGERGFAVAGPHRPTPDDPLAGMTAEHIEANVRNTVLPDEDDSGDEHPYEWLRELLGRQGVVVTTASLRSVPYTVELSDRLRQLLARGTARSRRVSQLLLRSAGEERLDRGGQCSTHVADLQVHPVAHDVPPCDHDVRHVRRSGREHRVRDVRLG